MKKEEVIKELESLIAKGMPQNVTIVLIILLSAVRLDYDYDFALYVQAWGQEILRILKSNNN